MAFIRGLSGYFSLGGQLQGSAFINGSFGTGVTTINIDGNGGSLLGVAAQGDSFTVAGETGSPVHTLVNAFYPAVANAIAGLQFTPGLATGGVADNAAVTFTSNAVAQIKSWSANTNLEELDTTSMGDAWKSVVGGQANWTAQIVAHLDYGDPRQKAIIDKVVTGTPVSQPTYLTLGFVRDTSPQNKLLYGTGVINSGQFNGQLGQIFQLTLGVAGSGALLPSWQ